MSNTDILYEKISYIYKITNKINGKKYYGQSVEPIRRWRQHKSTSKNSNRIQCSIHLAMKKYGIDNFDFNIVEVAPLTEIDKREVYYINRDKTNLSQDGRDAGYNMVSGGSNIHNRSDIEYTSKLVEKIASKKRGGRNPNSKLDINLVIKIINFKIDNPKITFSDMSRNFFYSDGYQIHSRTIMDIFDPKIKSWNSEIPEDLKLKMAPFFNRKTKKYAKFSEEDITEMKRLYANGMKYTPIAKKFKASPLKVIQAINGLEGKKMFDYSNVDVDTCLQIKEQLILSKLSIEEIAQKFTITPDTVKAILRGAIMRNVGGPEFNKKLISSFYNRKK